MPHQNITPVCLCILDGFGIRDESDNNAIALANTPNIDAMYEKYPHCQLGTDGLNVGLPEGQMGNSEVGHMNIGGGRIVMQNLPKINDSILNNDLKNNLQLIDYIANLKASGGDCHLLGMASDGGVHSHINHIIALAEIIASNQIQVNLHLFLDGRDTAPQSAQQYIDKFTDLENAVDNIIIATISGRYYAMDRDSRWDRVQLAYDVISNGTPCADFPPSELLKTSYNNNVYDEFFVPTALANYSGMNDGDGILMANFRSDRAREIFQTFVDDSFDGFERQKKISFSAKLAMVNYSDYLDPMHKVIFPAKKLQNTIGEIVADAGLQQLRIAETEKFAHITFFLNGGVEDEFTGEDRILVKSPDVATYDLQPEMSAVEVTEKLVAAIKLNKYSLFIVNFANMDMVGHTGDLQAAIKAAEQLDKSVEQVKNAMISMGGIIAVTADHGNAEMMVNPTTGEPHTAHTLFKVPFIVAGSKNNLMLSDGKLCDIAPTILEMMGLDTPDEMTGESLT